MKGIYWLKTPDKADTENGKKSRHMTCKCHRKYLCNVVREGR
ncbi:hypothetical protein PC129_g19433 [Phytophthora cactorum]|uniref:Uncharacterized protein n=1 Tax=Phytophthora cactorum TaxID=29920 RepID=A0A8T1HCL3_9STRA|nr:hypothetical protein PC129_g19433 [Phytophthora cactorum]